MNSRHLHNNNDLFEYLVSLNKKLESKHQFESAKAVYTASRFASGSSSEFYHEAQQALKLVKLKCTSVLTSAELAEITGVIEQIETAFKKIGGA